MKKKKVSSGTADIVDDLYYSEENPCTSEEMQKKAMSLASQTKADAQHVMTALLKLKELQGGSVDPDSDASEAIAASMENALQAAEEAKQAMEEAYQNACDATESAAKVRDTHKKEVEKTAELLRMQKEALREAEEALQSAKDSAQQIAAMGIREKGSERAKRLNDGTVVTVVCVTYNHGPYLAETLEGFLAQKTNFKFKVFVGEDCSTDNTREVLREYAEKYPDIIIPFYREKNMGALENTYDLITHLTSPFVAYCEGDDYWIDEYKLQKQYDLMQSKPYLRVCFHNTEITNNGDYHSDWYKKREDGKVLIPDSFPEFDSDLREFDANYYVQTIPAHTSSMFFRWNYDIVIPDSFRRGNAGDNFMLLMQLGRGKIGFMPDIMSVYRRSTAGETWCGGDLDKRWLSTRMLMIEWLGEIETYFHKYYGGFATVTISNRIKQEAYNYCKRAIAIQDYSALEELFAKYPKQAATALNAYLVFFEDSRALVNAYTWEGYKLIVRNKYARLSLRPYAKMLLRWDKRKRKRKNSAFHKKIVGFRSMAKYWINGLVPKKKNLWVFSTLLKRGYLDNCKYLYEYILENHPEIQPVWLTLDDQVVTKLRAEGKPVYKMSSKKGKKIMRRAQIAFINNNRITDLDNNYGFNSRTKVVQLWHGVGLKDMRKILHLTDFRKIGLVHSDDILPALGDSAGTKLKKKFKYLRHAHSRELFERYFMLACPGQERVEKVADVWGLPHDRCFMVGHPRDINLYKVKPDYDEPKILYAPTYRYNVSEEIELAQGCADAYPQIQELMEKINGQFVIRIHPYTWHNYKNVFLKTLNQYDRISFDTTNDIYETIGQYAVMISDFSSIAFDFVVADRPIIFHCPDLETYLSGDCGISYNFNDVTPGPKTRTWEETLSEVEQYVRDPKKDSDWRKRVGAYFFDPESNNENNSERIVCELKKRLGMK